MDLPAAAAYGEFSFTASLNGMYTIYRIPPTTCPTFSLHGPGGGTQTKDSKGDVTGLVVGIVFGTAAVALLVLGGWFIMKKFYWAGGLPHAFN